MEADERELLTGYLDWYRSVVEGKVADLSLQDASRIMTPTGLSPLGIVKHLSDVEQSWFRERFAGEEIDTAWSDDDPGRLPHRAGRDRGVDRRVLPSRRTTHGRSWPPLDEAGVGESPFTGTSRYGGSVHA